MKTLSPSNTPRLSIAFTSDEHGQLSNAGKLQTEVSKMRKQNPEGSLLISCGDIFQGSAETDVLGVEASSEILKRAGYDYITLGNHDFDFGSSTLKQWIANAPCPVLNSNITDSTGKLLEGTVPSVIHEVEGHKVGLIGCTTPETSKILSPQILDGVQFTDPKQAVRREVKRLKEQGAEIIGVVSHLGIDGDRELANSQPGVDFILGGHSHLAMTEKEVVADTVVVHGGSGRQSMGQVEILLDGTSASQNAEYHLIEPSENTSMSDPLSRFVGKQEAIVDKAMGKVVTTLKEPVAHDPDQLCDAMEELTARACLNRTDGELYLVNQKGIRSSLPAGDVTLRDVFKVFPFDSSVITLDMTVGQLKDVYTESFRRLDQTSLTMIPKADYGIGVALDPKSKELEFYLNGAPMDDDIHLKVTTSTYLQEGGLGYLEAGKDAVTGSYPTFREVLGDYLAEQDPE